jgi:hypothetical protein
MYQMLDSVGQSRSNFATLDNSANSLRGKIGDSNPYGSLVSQFAGTSAASQLEGLQALAKSGATLTAVEQGTLARLLDTELAQAKPGSTPATSSTTTVADTKAAAAKPKGPVTVEDLKLSNATEQDKADLKAALEYLQAKDSKGVSKSPAAVKLLEGIRDKGTTINFIHDGNDAYFGSTNVIDWDPKSGLAIQDNKGNLTGGTQSAALGLVHEADHAVNGQKKVTTYSAKDKSFPYGNSEEKRVITGTEKRIANDLGEPTRVNHNGQPVTLGSSTDFTATPKPPATPKK